jgi:hypothetical protein
MRNNETFFLVQSGRRRGEGEVAESLTGGWYRLVIQLPGK